MKHGVSLKHVVCVMKKHATLNSRWCAPKGSVTVRGRCCFSAQDAWIRNASLRDNVLMGQPWDEARYWGVIDACALQPDLDQLIAGERLGSLEP